LDSSGGGVKTEKWESSITSYVETIRKEIKRIQHLELFYQSHSYHTDGQKAARARRKSRLFEMQARLEKLRNLPTPSFLPVKR